MTYVSTTWVVVIFRVKWRVFVRWWYLCLWSWFGLVSFVVVWLLWEWGPECSHWYMSSQMNRPQDPSLGQWVGLTSVHVYMWMMRPSSWGKLTVHVEGYMYISSQYLFIRRFPVVLTIQKWTCILHYGLWSKVEIQRMYSEYNDSISMYTVVHCCYNEHHYDTTYWYLMHSL